MASVAALAGKRPASGGREGDQMVITPLGAGSEVGRSCVHLTFKGRTVLVSTSSPLSLANPTCFRFPLLLLIGTIVLRCG
jgi:predicted metal-dependent RNase